MIFSLLNLSPYLNDMIRSYSNYRLNLKSIGRSEFDLICEKINPDQVNELILSDDKDTPGQSQLFLSFFQINQFRNLQSLILIEIEEKSLKMMIKYLNQLKHLRSLSLKSDSVIILPFPLKNLRYLKLCQSPFDQLKTICLTTPQLKTLNITIIDQTANLDIPCELHCLTRLFLKIDGNCYHSMKNS